MKKQIFKISLMGVFLAGSLTFAGCGGNNTGKDSGQTKQNQEQSKQKSKTQDQKSAYICPMECEGSASEEAGQCPECGMDLVKRSELDEEGQ
jgi:hypothetical protein